MANAPISIKARQEEGVLELQWPHGTFRLPYRFLRGRCPCASCVDEVSGIRVVDVEDVPIEIAPAKLSFSGNYALKIAWSDRHDTGLFTWDYLDLLCRNLETGLAASSTKDA